VIQLLGIGCATVVLLVGIICPVDRKGRGRHVSRPLGRAWRLHKSAIMGVQALLLAFDAMVVLFIGIGEVALVMELVTVVWFVDDALTGGSDDDRKRRRRRANARLRLPKTVKLRPVERVRAPLPA